VVFSATAAPDRAEPTETGARTRRGRTGLLRRSQPEALRTRLRLRGGVGETVVPLRAEDGFSIVLGTEPRGGVQVAIEDRFVSAEHCRIAWQDKRWVLTDLKSSNGTFV